MTDHDKRELAALVQQQQQAIDRDDYPAIKAAAKSVLAVFRRADPDRLEPVEVDGTDMHPETKH
ncbi:MAG: hypothetical protein OXG35_14135 [Acidobacteria bacterium]|nr:hypothetical protein [Acidobacteriota bacterium]